MGSIKQLENSGVLQILLFLHERGKTKVTDIDVDASSGTIELPSGNKQKIFIAQNETGRFTAMLPEEY